MPDETTKNGDVNRREFFLRLGLGSLSIAVIGTAAFSYQYLEPNVLYEPSPVVNAGKPERYPLDSVTLDVTNAILWLASDDARYITGTVVPVDAGNINRY